MNLNRIRLLMELENGILVFVFLAVRNDFAGTSLVEIAPRIDPLVHNLQYSTVQYVPYSFQSTSIQIPLSLTLYRMYIILTITP